MIAGNPFPEADYDRWYIWQMLVARDIEAFLNQNWAMVADDFISGQFTGIDGCNSDNPDDWKFRFPDVEPYKVEWLKQAESFNKTEWAEDTEAALHRVTELLDIEINNNAALVHKKFLGNIARADGQKTTFNWQSLYYCREVNGVWKITGFTGYLPLVEDSAKSASLGKQLPENSSQHKTAGPYSPVLIVEPGKLVVISGQAAITTEGTIAGDTIEDQAAYTLENCRGTLAQANCSLSDVFKVNVFMKDLGDWERFNEVYKSYFEHPLPVRTAVQTGLLPGLLVEVELWAIKK